MASFDLPNTFAARWLAANNLLQRYPALTPEQILTKLHLCPVFIEGEGWKMMEEEGSVLGAVKPVEIGNHWKIGQGNKS